MYPQYIPLGLCDGDERYVPRLDRITKAACFIDIFNAMVHIGRAYAVGIISDRVDRNTPKIIAIRTARNCPLHLYRREYASGIFTLELFRDSTLSSIGTPVTAVNMNEESDRVSCSSISEDPVVTDFGTLVIPTIFGGNSRNTSTVTASRFEWILRRDTLYVLRYTANLNRLILGVILNWYEINSKEKDSI